MAVEFGCIHALDIGDAALVLAFVLNARAVFKRIDTFGQVVEVEVRGGVSGAFVVTTAVLILVAT